MLSPLLYVRDMAVNKAGKTLFSVLLDLLLTFQNGIESLQPAEYVIKVIKAMFSQDTGQSLDIKRNNFSSSVIRLCCLPPK